MYRFPNFKLTSVEEVIFFYTPFSQSQKRDVHRKQVSAYELGSSKKCKPTITTRKYPTESQLKKRVQIKQKNKGKNTWTHKSFTVYYTNCIIKMDRAGVGWRTG